MGLIVELIHKKRRAQELTFEELKTLINGLLDGSVADYQMSAFLMAVCCQGMTDQETFSLTKVMLESGKILNFKNPHCIDKHSTGGIGDKASFILAPIAAACGISVPMVAGRGLGHTGGTIDKVEAIPGFKTGLSLAEFSAQLKKEKIVLMGQTLEIAPADRRIYALRDVTATVESIPLITASILSKKLAEGASGIVMDIKVGQGAFMSNMKDAKNLAQSLIRVSKKFGKKMTVVITDMNQPLGRCIGNSIEIVEAVETLQNKGPHDLTEISLILAAEMVLLGKKAKNIKEAYNKCRMVLENGEALKIFNKLIQLQGGDVQYVKNLALLKNASGKMIVNAKKSGYVDKILNRELGELLVSLGGGRTKTGEAIDFSVGMICHKKIGEAVKKGEALLTIYHHPEQLKTLQDLKEYFLIKTTKTKKLPLVYQTIRGK
jgi:pyrimidine-nucleoside phosphorylase